MREIPGFFFVRFEVYGSIMRLSLRKGSMKDWDSKVRLRIKDFAYWVIDCLVLRKQKKGKLRF